MFGHLHADLGNLRIVPEKVSDQQRAKLFDASDVMLARQHVHRILDGVRGQNLTVVAGFVAALEITLKENLKSDLFEIVAIGVPRELNQPDARFSIGVPNQDRVNCRDRWCIHKGSIEEGCDSWRTDRAPGIARRPQDKTSFQSNRSCETPGDKMLLRTYAGLAAIGRHGRCYR